MQLTYRGVQYNYSPKSAEAMREATVFRALRPAFNLHYRGTVYAVNPNVEPNLPVAQTVGQLVYRGVVYALNGGIQPVAVSSQPSVTRHVSSKTEFTIAHRENLYKNLQHRLQVARAKEDQTLIHLLERELQQIV